MAGFGKMRMGMTSDAPPLKYKTACVAEE